MTPSPVKAQRKQQAEFSALSTRLSGFNWHIPLHPFRSAGGAPRGLRQRGAVLSQRHLTASLSVSDRIPLCEPMTLLNRH